MKTFYEKLFFKKEKKTHTHTNSYLYRMWIACKLKEKSNEFPSSKKNFFQDHQSPYEKYIQNFAFTGQTGGEAAYGGGGGGSGSDQYSSNNYSDRGGGGGSGGGGGGDYSDRGNSRG